MIPGWLPRSLAGWDGILPRIPAWPIVSVTVQPGTYSNRRNGMHLESTFAKFRQNAIHIFVCSFLLSFILVTSSRAQSEVYTKWTARFDAAHTFDQPYAMAVDGRGNHLLNCAASLPDACSPLKHTTLTFTPPLAV